MPPTEYLRAREGASSSGDELYCVVIDGAPYFPNLVVGPATPPSSIEERDKSIKKVIEQLILQIAKGTDQASSLSLIPSSWTISPVTGGNTNQLFCVSGIRCGAAEGEPNPLVFPNDSLLVRLFGADGMIDRDAETSTYASLASQQLALKYYGRFGNGRIEEMLVGWATLTEGDLMGQAGTAASDDGSQVFPPTNLNEAIARDLAKLHATYELPEHLLVEKGNSSDGDKMTAGGDPSRLPEPTLWTQLYPWLERALRADFRTERDTERAQHELDPPLSSLRAEIDWLKSKVIGNDDDGKASSVGIGFCHNDLLASNIMMRTSKDPTPASDSDNHVLRLEGLQFIDFEYGGINYYAYDIANHFNEYAGGTAVEDNSTPDYDRCPSEQEQWAFLEAYADAYNRAKSARNESTTITAEELSALVDGFVLANHLVWGLWGVLQAASEGCEDGLDYLHYAKCRFDRYRHDKHEKYGNTS